MTSDGLDPVLAQRYARMALAQRHLLDYCKLNDPNYIDALHTRYMIKKLEELERRDIKALIFEFPPRHSKTYHSGERFPAWYLGRNPTHQVIHASYSDRLAGETSMKVRRLLESDVCPWGSNMLNRDTRAVDRWLLLEGGGMRAAGVGGGITGFGADLFNIDDAVKDREAANSKLQRDNLWDWYRDVAATRMAPDGVECITGTRWHEDDLIGRVLEEEGDIAEGGKWTRVRLPAIAEADDPLGRAEGEALWPERYPLQILEDRRITMSSYGFAALYQQRPSPEEGGEFKRAWMQRWASLPPDRLNERGQRQKTRWRVFQAVDSSWDEGVAHDYSVIATWATDGRDYFVLDLWRGRVEYPDLIKAIRRTYRNQRFQPRLILIEDAANGRPVIQTLKREGFPVKGITPVGSKEQRADDVTPAFESMHVYLPPDAEWVEDWIEEHVTFPNATHDDQVDTTSLALGYMMPKPAALLPNRTLGGRARATQAV